MKKILLFLQSLPSLAQKHPKRSLVIGILLLALGWHFLNATTDTPAEFNRPQPVRVAPVSIADVPVYLNALGTVVPTNTALVQSRVSGELTHIYFTEGELVEAGAVLAQIDPRPYQVQLEQAKGAKERDLALLKGAELDLARFQKLVKEGSVPMQQLQAQEATVGQYKGSLIIDNANIADAELLLTYCRITAPISGRVGLKKVDIGNMVQSNDSTGIIVITQTDPMLVTFPIVERDLPEVMATMHKNPLIVEAWSQGNTHLLATGALNSLDNRIDTQTGTVMAKATFTGAEQILFPNQFANVRLLVHTEKNALTIPSSAVQRSSDGFFVFVVEKDTEDMQDQKKAEKNRKETEIEKKQKGPQHNATTPLHKRQRATVHIQNITIGVATDTHTIVQDGLAADNLVVIDGVDRLREKSAITFTLPQ